MVENIVYKRGNVTLLDQRLLPGAEKYVTIATPEEMARAIQTLTVRGAPAIGIAAAYGLCLAAAAALTADVGTFRHTIMMAAERIKQSRPTAVNLFYAVDRMLHRLSAETATEPEALCASLEREADAIRDDEKNACLAIGEYLLTLLTPGSGILTHCNAGGIATVQYGTALAPLLLGAERGISFHVYADETRPLLQGARLTAWELSKAGVDVTVICDSMAAQVMKEGRVQAVIVGCDRVAANGDTANKIGTYSLAVNAAFHKIPLYVAAPVSTIDTETGDGGKILIEERSAEEITQGFGKRTVPEGVGVYNPAFDVTPGDELISAIVTERGILRPPYTKSIAELIKQQG
jgi:methylthioribose-1-phosphate isomerase